MSYFKEGDRVVYSGGLRGTINSVRHTKYGTFYRLTFDVEAPNPFDFHRLELIPLPPLIQLAEALDG